MNGISLAKDPDSTAVSANARFLTPALEIYSQLNFLCKFIISVSTFFSFQPSLPDFHSTFQVVFVDPSGHLNMCADMTSCTYKQVNAVKIKFALLRFKQDQFFYVDIKQQVLSNKLKLIFSCSTRPRCPCSFGTTLQSMGSTASS